jgi:hypothetical protein
MYRIFLVKNYNLLIYLFENTRRVDKCRVEARVVDQRVRAEEEVGDDGRDQVKVPFCVFQSKNFFLSKFSKKFFFNFSCHLSIFFKFSCKIVTQNELSTEI